jgi:hypothetical protein
MKGEGQLGALGTMARASRQSAGRALLAVAAAGATVSLVVVYHGVRGVLASGGFCAGGGAYAIAHQCDRAETVMLLLGVLGMLTFGGLLVAVTAWRHGPIVPMALVLWVAVFGTLAWNLIDLGADPPRAAAGADVGLIVSGAAFGLMALSGLAPLVRLSSSRIATGNDPGGGHLRGGVLRG